MTSLRVCWALRMSTLLRSLTVWRSSIRRWLNSGAELVSNHSRAKFCWAGLGTMAMVFVGSTLSISGQAQTTGKHGKELFEKRCGGCHALDRDKEGPRLGGVYGRAAASVPSFDYSAALKNS